MKLLKVIPKVFYEDVQHGLRLFIDGLGFEIKYQEPKFYIIDRDGVTLMLIEDAEFAIKDRPELRIATDDIGALYQEVCAKDIPLLHPNLSGIKKQPWGLLEFALKDESDVCVIIQQNDNDE